MEVTFDVLGDPVPQGSMRAFVVKGRAVLTSTSKNLKPWRAKVAEAAANASDGQMFASKTCVSVTCIFRMRRPQSHCRADGTVKPSAPSQPCTRPDIDKLARAILDGLTGVLFDDDSQVTTLKLLKTYAEPRRDSGVHIHVRQDSRKHPSEEGTLP